MAYQRKSTEEGMKQGVYTVDSDSKTVLAQLLASTIRIE